MFSVTVIVTDNKPIVRFFDSKVEMAVFVSKVIKGIIDIGGKQLNRQDNVITFTHASKVILGEAVPMQYSQIVWHK